MSRSASTVTSSPSRLGRLAAYPAGAVTLRAPLDKRYFVIGMAALVVLALGIGLGVTARHALPKPVSFAFSIGTGLILLTCILYQWMLFFARLAGRTAAARRHWNAHRYVGVAAIGLFVLHGGTMGYAMVSVLALGFLVVALTGLWNTEVAILRKPWLRTAWQIGHIGVSGLIMPLILLHAWAALAFK